MRRKLKNFRETKRLARVDFDVKALKDSGEFEGYASVFGNKDFDGDVVVKGAFARTLERTKGKVPILWQHNMEEPIGLNLEAKEDEHGLWVKGKLDVDSELGRRAFNWIKLCIDNGFKAGLSIGYRVIQYSWEKGARLLKELALGEYSVVTYAANELAAATAVKAMPGCGATLMFAPENTSWDATAAVKRLVEFCQDDDGLEYNEFKKAFLVVDEESDPDCLLSYKFPVADVIDDQMMIVPRALKAARKSVPSRLDDGLAAEVIAVIDRLEKRDEINAGDETKMHKKFKQKALDFVQAFQTAQDEAALQKLRWEISDAMHAALHSVCEDESMTIDEKVATTETIYQQFSAAMIEWHRAQFELQAAVEAAEGDDAGDESEVKAGRVLSQRTKSILEAAISQHEKACHESLAAFKKHKDGINAIKSLLGGINSTDEELYSNRPRKPKVTAPAKDADPVPEQKQTDPKDVTPPPAEPPAADPVDTELASAVKSLHMVMCGK